MTLTRYGIREWLGGSVILIPLIAGSAILALWLHPLFWILAAIFGAAWFAILSFFRDPLFRSPASNAPGDMVSPADGTISAVFETPNHEAVEGPAMVIRIFLSVLNVHVNRAPCDGQVVSITHRPGKYLDARTEESARVNESNLIVLQAPWGDRIGVRQVSGKIARRIVCGITTGDRVTRAGRFGMIKFGSTTELILPKPAGVKALVAVGDKVKGGVTILAKTSGAANASPTHS